MWYRNLVVLCYPLMLLLLLPVLVQGQDEQKVIPPSPNAAALAKYGTLPVSTYTGVPNIEVPLYTIQSRDITVPISLSYHASGIKVGEEASRVGLGWSLNCGGVISRNIVGWDDFLGHPGAYLNKTRSAPPLNEGPRFVPLDWTSSGTIVKFLDSLDIDVNNPVQLELEDYIYGSEADYEPDQFTFNFLGRSGKFIMGPGGKPLLEKQEKIRMEPDEQGHSWVVTTADGYKYTFGTSEYFVDNQSSGNQQISSWYLTEITSPKGETVTFEYLPLGSQFTFPVGQFQETFTQPVPVGCSTNCSATGGLQQGALPRKHYSNVFLSSVKWDYGKVDFTMGTREDLDGDLKVESVKVFRKVTSATGEIYELMNDYKFAYTYFDHNAATPCFPIDALSTDYLQKRLKLVSLGKYPAHPQFPKEWEYSFSYYEGDGLRLPQKNSYARDHWGYFNGKVNYSSLIPTFQYVSSPGASAMDMIGAMGNERDPSPSHMKAFTLKEIVYPTGGKTTFHYGTNDFDPGAESQGSGQEVSPQYAHGLYLRGASYFGQVHSVPIDLTDQYVSGTGQTIPIEINAAFVANVGCEGMGVPDMWFKIYDLAGNEWKSVSLGLPFTTEEYLLDHIYCSQIGATAQFKYRGLVQLPPGEYLWKGFINGTETRFEAISAMMKWWKVGAAGAPDPLIKFVNGGGLRIERMEDTDPVTGLVQTREFEYHYETDENDDDIPEIHSYGRRMARPKYSYFNINWERKENPPNSGNFDTCLGCVQLIRQSDSFIPATGSQGHMVGYDKVIERFGPNGENGWIEYEFENVPDVPITIYHPQAGLQTFEIRPPAISTRANSSNGTIKKKTEFRADGLPVHQLVTNYFPTFNTVVYGLSYRRIPAPGFQNTDYTLADELLQVNRADVIKTIYPAITSALQVPAQVFENFYDDAGNHMLTKTSYNFYENSEHLQLTKSMTIRSDDHVIATSYKYPADYSEAGGGPAISKMKALYMHSMPVEVTVKDETPGLTMNVLASNLTVYDQFQGRVFPKAQIALEQTKPTPAAELTPYIPSAGFDVSKYRSLFTMRYSPYGNIEQIDKPLEAKMSYIWGYNQKYPVAEIRNVENTFIPGTPAIPTEGTVAITMGSSGTTVSQNYSFTTQRAGTVYLRLGVPAQSPLYSTSLQFTGFAAGTVTLATGGCGITVIPFTNLQPGTYSITITLEAQASTEGVGGCGEIIYPTMEPGTSATGVLEAYYEGFEDMTGSNPDPENSHTGIHHYFGDFIVNYTLPTYPLPNTTLPTSRTYKIEYWYRDSNSDWIHISKPYAGPSMQLNEGSAIDDIRIYPVDAQMKSFTYDPVLGITSIISESGQVQFYDYDTFGRLARIRDEKGNVEKAYKYSYSGN